MLEPFLNVLSDSKQLQLTVREQQWHQVNGWLYKERVEWDWSVGSGLCPHLTAPGSSGSLGLFIQLITTEKKTLAFTPCFVFERPAERWKFVCVFLMNIYECVLFVWGTDESLWRGQCSEGAASIIGNAEQCRQRGWVMGFRRREWSRTCPAWANKLINSLVDRLKRGVWEEWTG